MRTEIARKQKDAENKQALISGSSLANSGSSAPLSDRARQTGHDMYESTGESTSSSNSSSMIDEVNRLKEQLDAQDSKWRVEYEKLAKENEALRSKGGEAVLAAQWRVRYESCFREKEDLSAKLRHYATASEELSASGVSPEHAYVELHEQFKVCVRCSVLTPHA